MPVTKLGRLVKDRKITTLEEIYLNSLPIKVCISIGSSFVWRIGTILVFITSVGR